MKNTSMTVTLALSTALALTACGPEQAGGDISSSSGSGTSSSSSSTRSPESSNNSSNSSQSSSSSPSSSEERSNSAASQSDSKSGAPEPEQATRIPAGPMTKATVIKAGGYRKHAGGKFGEFYAVLKVDGTGPGRAKLQYDLLDADRKVLNTVNDTIKIGQGSDMIKVSTKLTKVPDGTKRIRLRVVENSAAERGDDITITGVTVKNHAESDRPVITGNYVTHGESHVTGFRAVCSDANNRVIVGHGLPDTKDAKSGTFTAKLGEAPRYWEAQNCYVGQSGY